MTVNHRSQMSPAVASTRDVSHIHGPALVAPVSLAPPALYTRPRGDSSLVHEPLLPSEYGIDGLPVNRELLSKAKQRPDPPVPKGRMLLDQPRDPSPQELVPGRSLRFTPRAPMQHRSRDRKHVTHLPLGDADDHAQDSSGVLRSKGR